MTANISISCELLTRNIKKSRGLTSNKNSNEGHGKHLSSIVMSDDRINRSLKKGAYRSKQSHVVARLHSVNEMAASIETRKLQGNGDCHESHTCS